MEKKGSRLFVGEHEAGSLDDIVSLFSEEAIYRSPTGAEVCLGKAFKKPIG